ncbi:MAG TPA: hypothetical protein VF311_03360, partial [Terriglobales bacterium]
ARFERRTVASIWEIRCATSDPTPMNHSNKDGKPPAESEEGRLLIKENTLPSGAYPTLSGSARVPRVGECADKLYAWPLFICDKSRMR